MTDDRANVARLRDEQIKVINHSTAQIEKWESLQKEYNSLKEKLTTLPQKVECKTMVPIGSVGLFPGKLIHTNEITVLLGDNWFVQRSACQASEIVDRRLSILNERLKDANKEVKFFESQKKFTENLSSVGNGNKDIVNIKEEESEAISKRKKRIAHVSAHSVTPRQVRKFDEELRSTDPKLSLKKEDDTVDKLFARLDELEIEESMHEEISREDSLRVDNVCKQERNRGHVENGIEIDIKSDKQAEAKTRADGGIYEQQKSRVHFESVSTDSETLQTNDELDASTTCIRFNHTKDMKTREWDSQAVSTEGSDKQQMFQSPADIYKHFIKPIETEAEEKPLKSILKKERKSSNEGLKPRPILKHSPEHKAEVPSTDDVISHAPEERKPILKSGPEAVSSTVLEKQVNTPESSDIQATQKKPMSRFKASRIKKQ